VRSINVLIIIIIIITLRPAVYCGIAARLSVYRVVLQIPRARHARLVADIVSNIGLVTRHARQSRHVEMV